MAIHSSTIPWKIPWTEEPGRLQSMGSQSQTWVGKIPWRRKWQSTPVLFPGKSHGQRSLVDYSPQGCKESDANGQIHLHFHTVSGAGFLDILVSYCYCNKLSQIYWLIIVHICSITILKVKSLKSRY